MSNGSDAVGVRINASGITLDITGTTGSIQGRNDQAALDIASGSTGGIISNAATLGGSSHSGAGIQVNANTVAINNTGAIESTSIGLQVTTGDTLNTVTNSASGARGIRGHGNNGVAIDISGNVDTINNTGGLITSSFSSNTFGGTLQINVDVSGLNIIGGTISNTGGGNVLSIFADQSASIVNSSALIATSTTNAVRFAFAGGTFQNSGAITGNITSSADTTAQTIINTGGSVTGNITLNDGIDTVILSGGSINGNIDLGDGTDIFEYSNAASATSLTGTLEFGAGTNTLTINENFTTGGVITSTNGISNATISAGKTLTANHSINLGSGSLTTNGTTRINAGQSIVTTGTDTLGSSGKYVFEVGAATTANGSGSSNGLLSVGGAQSAINSVDQIEIAVTASANLAQGGQVRLVRGGATETFNFTGQAAIDNSTLFDFFLYNGDDSNVAINVATGDDIIAEVDRVGAGLVGTANATAIDPILVTIGQTGDANFDAIQGNFASANTTQALADLYASLGPDVTNGAQYAVAATADQVNALVDSRLSGIRGVSSGSETLDSRVWAQAYGKTAKQDNIGTTPGYDADTVGGAFGADTLLEDGATNVGATFSYGTTDITGQNVNRTDATVDSYQLTVYGDHNFDQGTFVEGMVAYAWNEVEQTRKNIGGVAGLNANADYAANAYGLRGVVGHSFPIADGTKFTPKAFAAYLKYDPDSYTETGAGTANLNVVSNKAEQMNLGISGELSSTYTSDTGTIKPSVNLGYKYDLMGDEVNTTASFSGVGGGSFLTKGGDKDKDKGTLTAGLGIDFLSQDNWQMTAKYNFEMKDNFESHGGLVRAGYRF